ncbi:MAG: 1,6-anhydro-N-acetylmuramyl-L-alanine amidase AmpD [Thalassotalea sp.]
MSSFQINNGWLQNVEHQQSPHYSNRPESSNINLLVIHNISLPPGKFGGDHITNLFLGRLDPCLDPFFAEIAELKVSAHCLIKRDGSVIQYVSFNDMAWHAGVSTYQGKAKCNDFSIGIELEGTDTTAYTESQYAQLSELTNCLLKTYPEIKDNITGHCDIAPDRKTDPGPAFNWHFYKSLIIKE